MSKKSWTKSSKKDKVYLPTVFTEQADYETAMTALKTMKILTVATVCDRCKIGASLARKMLHQLVEEKVIVPAQTHSRLSVYVNPVRIEAKAEKTEEPTTKKGKKQQ